MKLSNIWIVYHKELIDILRDRRTIIAMVVFPIVIFPIMTVGFGNLAESSVRKARTTSTRTVSGVRDSTFCRIVFWVDGRRPGRGAGAG